MQYEWVEVLPGRLEYQEVDSKSTCVAQVHKVRERYTARLFKRGSAIAVERFDTQQAAKQFVERTLENSAVGR